MDKYFRIAPASKRKRKVDWWAFDVRLYMGTMTLGALTAIMFPALKPVGFTLIFGGAVSLVITGLSKNEAAHFTKKYAWVPMGIQAVLLWPVSLLTIIFALNPFVIFSTNLPAKILQILMGISILLALLQEQFVELPEEPPPT